MADTSSDDILNQIVNQLLAKQTGGGNAFTDVGQVLSGAAAGNAAGVNSANTTALAGGALSNNLFQSALERAKLQAALPNFRAQQAVTGDQIANTQDVVPTGPANVMSHVVNFTGGRRPSNLGPNARSAGAALSGIGAANIGKDVLPAVPSMPKLSDGGVLGKVLGGGALASSVFGSLLPKNQGSSGNIVQAGKDLINWLTHRGGGNNNGLDLTDPNTFVGPMDPNTFVGPMQDGGSPEPDYIAAYDEWLRQQGQDGQWGGGGSGDQGPQDGVWHP